MAKISTNYNKLQSNYLFSEIAKRTKAFLEKNPGAQIMRLGIGNTTESLTPSIVQGLMDGVKKLSDVKTYTGYGDEQGDSRLRMELAKFYQQRGINLEEKEIFISDGAKPDCANITSIFGEDSVVAVADPVYPVYVDSNIIAGKKLVYMECNERIGFIPTPPKQKVDLIFICSPNNPTGAVATRAQLQAFVDYALKNKSIIIFDGAYAEYIQDPKFPRSIYEIPGARECAIEINSFSKWVGFTGVRLGWTIVPMDLVVEGAEKGKVNSLWNRRQTTMFNGASNIAQEGGLAVLSKEGQKECKKLISYYMNNAKVIKEGLANLSLKVFGGENAPYIWVRTPARNATHSVAGGPSDMSSWEFFDKLLSEAHVVGTPGSGFGSQGEGYLRLSAFGHREDVEKAVKSIQENLKI